MPCRCGVPVSGGEYQKSIFNNIKQSEPLECGRLPIASLGKDQMSNGLLSEGTLRVGGLEPHVQREEMVSHTQMRPHQR
jgi:hypothetical protein